MLDAIKPLLDSDLVNEETRSAIAEQWEAKMNETRQQVTAELREEFAQRYEHDKSTMVEALDRMVTEGLTTELEQIAEERKAAVEDRAKAVQALLRPALITPGSARECAQHLQSQHLQRHLRCMPQKRIDQCVGVSQDSGSPTGDAQHLPSIAQNSPLLPAYTPTAPIFGQTRSYGFRQADNQVCACGLVT